MMWVFSLPNWFQFILVMTVIVGGSVLGLVWLRKPLRRYLDKSLQDHNEAVGAFVQAFGVFYGITLGLVAVAAWENFEKCNDIVENEATALNAFARDVSVFPEPFRSELGTSLKEYVNYLIDHAWTDSVLNHNTPEALRRIHRIHQRLSEFEPKTPRETVLMQAALDQHNAWMEKRSTRIASYDTGLPAILWWILVIGAILNMLILYSLQIEPFSAHLALTGLIGSFIGLMIYLILIMDHPYIGDFRIEADAFRLLREYWKEFQGH